MISTVDIVNMATDFLLIIWGFYS